MKDCKELNNFRKIYHIDKKESMPIFEGEVIITEKVDGSQFSFGVFDGVLICRSKGSFLDTESPQALFKSSVEQAKQMFYDNILTEGLTYHCECMESKKHNKLSYDRVPKRNMVLYAVRGNDGEMLSEDFRDTECLRLGVENIKTLYKGLLDREGCYQFLEKLISEESYLGGCSMEGCVINDGQVYSKFVSPAFKEVINSKKVGVTFKDKLNIYKYTFKSQARWDKAIQRVRENGKLTETPKDIGLLIKEVINDVKEEEENEIKEWLFNNLFKEIASASVFGFPDYYKDEILKD